MCAITAEIEALKTHHATFEQRLDGLSVRASETSTTAAHDPAALEAIATAGAERVARDVENENMRDRIAPSHSADDQVAPPAIASRRGNRLLVPWMAGLTVAVLWILVRTLA